MFKKLFFLIFFSFSYLFAFNWSNVTNLSIPGYHSENGKIVINPTSNELLALWKTFISTNSVIQYSYSSNSRQNWSNVANLSNDIGFAFDPQIAITSSGKAIIVFTSIEGSTYRIAEKHSLENFGIWSDLVYLSDADKYAMNPKIALTSTGNAVIVWNESNGIDEKIKVKKSSNNFEIWSNAFEISEAGYNSTEPKIVINSSDEAIVIWKMFNFSNYLLKESHSSNGIENFSNPLNLFTVGYDVKDYDITKNNQEAIVAFTLYNGTHLVIQETHSINNLTSFSNPITLSSENIDCMNCKLTSINGEAVVVWSMATVFNDVVKMRYSSNNITTWSNPISISNPATVLYEPHICKYNLSDVLVSWREEDEHYNILVKESHSSNNFQNWSSPFSLSDADGSSFSLELISDNNTIVIPSWSRNINERLNIQMRFSN